MKPSDFYFYIDDDHSVIIYSITEFNSKIDSLCCSVVDKILDSIGFNKINDILYEYIDEDAEVLHMNNILKLKGFIYNADLDKYISSRSVVND